MEENKQALGEPEAAEDDGEADLITLTDEEGNEVTFEVIDAIDHNKVHYMALVEAVEKEEDVSDDLQLVIMRVGEDEEGEYLDIVDDDEELTTVSAIFEQRLKDEFDIKQ